MEGSNFLLVECSQIYSPRLLRRLVAGIQNSFLTHQVLDKNGFVQKSAMFMKCESHLVHHRVQVKVGENLTAQVPDR